VAEERWQYVRTDEWVALHKVALQARDAVDIAEAVGVHLGPLRAALDATAYRVSSPFAPRVSPAPDTEEA
jgi:hypothetical protein